MHLSSTLLVLALECTTTIAKPVRARSSARIPLSQTRSVTEDALSVPKQALHAIARRASGKTAVTPETLNGGFWFGSFDVGNANNLSLLIDTGSSDPAVNPGKYVASSASKNLNKKGQLQYSTTEVDGCGTADISYNEYQDTISFAGLTATGQTFANVINTTPPNSGTTTTFPGDGLVGFAGADDSELRTTPFFTNLCNKGAVSACRFGLAFNTDGTGSQILGELDSSLYTGTLQTASISDQWQTSGDVSVAGKVIAKNQQIIYDSGTVNVIGPPSAVKSLFAAAGIQAVSVSLPGCTEVLTGYYPCNAPPTIGLSLPTGSKTVWNIAPTAFDEASDGGNNCTAIVSGIDFGADTWIFGQAWMQGKYVDFDVSGNTLGVAALSG